MKFKTKISLLQIFLSGLIFGVGLSGLILEYFLLFIISIPATLISFWLGVKDID